jgi:hypothetical protein
MKRMITLTSMLVLIGFFSESSVVFGQALSATTFKVGYFNPRGSKSGFIFGGSYSWIIDEAVDVGLAVDYFRKNYTDETEIAKTVTDGKIVEKEIVTNAEFTTNILPIYGVVNAKFPAGYTMDYFISGGLGYEMLFSKEQTFGDSPKKTSRYYSGFKWILSAGIVYRIGSRSSFLAEAFYDGTKVSRDKKNEAGTPTRYEVDLSGFGVRVGIRMGFH